MCIFNDLNFLDSLGSHEGRLLIQHSCRLRLRPVPVRIHYPDDVIFKCSRQIQMKDSIVD